MNKVLDFDKFMNEKNRETVAVTVLGKEYKVAQEIPAIVPVTMARAEASNDPQQVTKMVMRAADALFGSDAVDEMCAKGISASDLATLVQKLFQIINGKDDDNDETEELTDEDSRKPVGAGKRAKK